MKISLFFASLQRRFVWLNVPAAMLITFLQRSPVVRVANAVEEMITSSPVSTVLKSAATLATLGAIHATAGATTLVPSAGDANGITVTAGSSVTVAYTVSGTIGAPGSWNIAGSPGPGLSFQNTSSSNLVLSGTPTTPGTYNVTITAISGATPDTSSFPYSIVVQAGGGGGNVAPAFTAQPNGQTVSVGANVTFTVAVTGTPTPTIQWKKNGTDVAGATSLSLTLNNVQTTDAGSYTAVATNSSGSTTSSAAALVVSTATSAPGFTTQPLSQNVNAGATVTFTVLANGTPIPSIQWQKNGANISGATSTTLTLNNVQTSDTGTYTAIATNSAGTATSNGAMLVVNAATGAVTINTQPVGHMMATGSSVVLSAEVTGASSYQWKKNGANVAGGTNSQLMISNLQGSDAGSYTLTASNGTSSATTNAATLNVTSSNDPGRLVNASVRIVSGTGDNVLIVGFVVGGSGTSGTKQLLIRGIGPTLAGFGVPGTMADPILQIIPQGSLTPVDSNDNWSGNATVVSVSNSVGAFALPDATSKDAALVTTLAAGPYSAKVAGVGNTSGTVLAELYDTTPGTYSPTTPRLINISARATSSNDNPLIAGFVIGGSTAKTVLIRAIGPTLGGFGVGGAMSDSKIELYVSRNNSNVLLASNDNWGGLALDSSVAASVGAFAITDAASKDSVLVITLDPGIYSANLLGVNNVSGVALIEVYEVP